MAKFKVEWSIEAKHDLPDIFEFYIKRNQSAVYSKKLNSKISTTTKLLSQNPSIVIKT